MDASSGSEGVERPAVSVILPFHGTAEEADGALAALAALELRPGDEVLVADNTEDGVAVGRWAPGSFAVFPCEVKRSAYAARNIAIERSANDWLLLIDADCRPRPDLLDRYFDPPPAGRTGAVAGQVIGVPDQPGLIPRYIRARRHLDQEWLYYEHPYRRMAVTANLLLRRAAWEQIGGFAEQTRSGADEELCWRLQDAGWELELRLEALVHHEHRATLGALLRQSARDGAGARWASRRHPGYPPRPKVVRGVVRAGGGAVVALARGRPRDAAFKVVDGVWALAAAAGSLQSNAAPVTAASRPATVAFLERYPLPGEPALAGADGGAVRIEARSRPERAHWRRARTIEAHLSEDDGPGVRAAAFTRLALRRPSRAIPAVLRVRARALELAPAALRLSRDPAAVRVAAVPGREDDARLMLRMAGRRPAVAVLASPGVPAPLASLEQPPT